MILRGNRRLSSVIERTRFINKSSHPNIGHRLKQGSLFALSASILLACQVELGPVSEIATDASLASGLVVDGPVVNARVSVIDAIGNTVATTVSGDDASYDVSIPQGTMYPVTITAQGGRDVVTQTEPLFPMVSVKLASDASVSNITPFSTLVVKMAQAMPGGVNEANLTKAGETVFAQFGFGLDPALVSSPVSSEVSGANVAAILKASEALTETIRRARDGLLIAGSYIDAEAILNVMAADMATDGVLDGLGTDVDPRIAATVTVASAPVLIEALSNNLSINGVNVTSSMDAGIALTEVPSAGATADVVISESMLVQARTAVSAAQALTSSEEISAITTVLDGLNGGSMASDIQNVLPPEKAGAFADILVQVVLATGTQLESINQVVRKADVANSGNTQTDTGSTGSGSTDGSSSGGESTTGSSTDGGSTGGTPADGGTSGTGTVDTGTSGDGATGGGSVVDTQAPMITLVGSSLITLATGQAYVEAGASAIDNVDGDISSNIVISGQVNVNAAGSYTVTYSVSDSSGNSSSAMRMVNVVAPVVVPGSFEFGSAIYSVDESAGKVDIEILRSGGSDGAVSVDWRTRTFNGYGTADFATDYTTVDWQPLAFADDETRKVISVNIAQDVVDEVDENFTLLLQNPAGGASLGARISALVTIVDDDTALVQGNATGSIFPSDTTLTPVTVATITRPGYLNPIRDPAFGAKVTRITDNAAIGINNLRHYYSKVSAWNSDGTLINMNRTLLDGKTYKKVGSFSSSGEMRWAHTNPTKMYNAAGNKFTITDVLLNQTTTLHTFSQYESCFMGPWEGNVSVDDRYVALACKKGVDLVVVVYDIKNNIVEAEKTFSGKWGSTNFDWLSISQSGQYVVINWIGSAGVVAYDRKLNVVSRLAPFGDHGDIGYDTSGNEVYVQYSWEGLFTSYRLKDGVSTVILDKRPNWKTGGHISCRNIYRPGWCYISVFNTSDVFAIKLDGSQTVERFAHHRSSVSSYDAQPQAVPSMDGTKVMFASDWGGSEISSYVAEMP